TTKRAEAVTPFNFTFEALGLTPTAFIAPWLKAQADMVTTMKGMTDHWYERRAADFAALQDVTAKLAGCATTERFAEMQTQCASALTERFMADLSGLRDDMVALGSAATSAFGALGRDGKGSPKLAAE